jgi:hypothetical protein
VDYAGDEGGIMCFIARHDKQEALVISLTYVCVPSSMPLGGYCLSEASSEEAEEAKSRELSFLVPR